MNTSRNFSSRCRGLSLVELMITLLITSVLILGAGGFLEAAHKSNTVQSAVSGLNSNGRFGLNQIARDVRMTGYRDSGWQFGALAGAVAADDNFNDTGSDRLRLSFEAARDCAFNAPAAASVTNTYEIVGTELRCNNGVISTGVEEMQVYFGEDTDNTGVANRYLSPGTAGLDMSNVVSVRIHLLTVSSGNEVASNAQAYFFDGQTRDAIDDGQIRREYSMTVAIRNQL